MGSFSTIPLWGRSYSLTVKYVSADQTQSEEIITSDAWEPEALKITFEVLESTLPSPYWFADITIWNMNDKSIQNALLNAVWATLSAGYQSQSANQSAPMPPGVIWDGRVLQVLFDRENVVDYKITLHCIATIPFIEQAIMNHAFGPLTSQASVVAYMQSQSNGVFKTQYSPLASQMLDQKQYPRGKTIFGKCSKYIFEMADDNFLNSWMSGNQAYFTQLDAGKVKPDITYASPLPPDYVSGIPDKSVTRSVIGVPKQTPFGVIFRVFLDPRLKVQVPPLLIQLDVQVISQIKVPYPLTPFLPLDQSRQFVVAQVKHVGDSRGQEWSTEVTGYMRGYCQNLLKGIFLSTSGGSQ